MSKSPSRKQFQEAETELKKLKRGAQKRVSDGVYMRLDGRDRRRFLARARVGGTLVSSRTYDTWEETEQARQDLLVSDPPPSTGDPTPREMQRWSVERYARGPWWNHVLLDCDVSTQLDYRAGLKGLLPLVRGVTMYDLAASPVLIDRIRAAAKKAKTYPKGHRREGEFGAAAADKIINTLRKICTHAVEHDVLFRNPLLGVPNFNRRRRAASDSKAPSHRRVLESEIFKPEMVARVGLGMRGNPITLLRRRLIPWLIATGLRPSDILAMRDFWWRDRNGPRNILHVDAAVKDLAGHLVEGEPKTGERDLHLFPAIGQWLEAIYQLEGVDDLESLTFPNKFGGLLDWGNWREQVWYPSLHRGGIIASPSADARGAFYPYQLRHVGVSVLLYAQRSDGRGSWSPWEVAEQFGHTYATLERVYGRHLPDLAGVAGLTMDEIIRRAMREVWGPMPGDPDFQEVEYDLLEAAELTGIDNKSLAARLQRGSIPGVKRAGKYYVKRFDLGWHGLVACTTADAS